MALPREVDGLKINPNFFAPCCLAHFGRPRVSLCRFKPLIGPNLGSFGPQNFVRERTHKDKDVKVFFDFSCPSEQPEARIREL